MGLISSKTSCSSSGKSLVLWPYLCEKQHGKGISSVHTGIELLLPLGNDLSYRIIVLHDGVKAAVGN